MTIPLLVTSETQRSALLYQREAMILFIKSIETALGLEPVTVNKSERRVLRYLRENPEAMRELEELASTRARP